MRLSAALGLVLSLGACGGVSPAAQTGEGRTAGEKAAFPAPPESEAPRGQLPEGAAPLAYTLDLTIDPRQDRFSGTAEIEIALDEAAGGVWLHGKGLDVSAVTLTGPDGKTREGRYEEVLPSGVAWLGFGEELGPGTITADIAYDAAFDRNLAGLFKVEEQGDAYALAKSESIQARKYMPGFDEPGLKAPFDITLTVPEGYAAISNGAELAREPAGDGMERVAFATTRPLSTYLLSLAVGPFDVVEVPAIPANAVRDEPIPLRGIARRGRGDDLEYILSITPDFVRLFEEQLGVPYPYEKLDIVAAPQWPSGATELAAAISYREERILADGTPPPAQRQSLISVHAHEIAHMWFGNLVTPPWWDDLWLKEGFATWGTPFVLTEWEPEGGHELIVPEGAIGAMRADSLASVRAVSEPIAKNDDIRNAYNAIPYRKGMALIAMADSYFGPETFRPALGRYIEAYEDEAADSRDFFEAIGEATGEPALTTSFKSFVEQPGVPFLDVALTCGEDGAVASLAQRRYRPLGSSIEEGQRWTIPVCVAYGGEEGAGRACTLMREERTLLPLKTDQCPAYIHPNADGAGYYRFSLDEDAADALIENVGSLSPAEALMAADSVFAAFEAGEASASTMLAMIEAAAGAEARQVVTLPLSRIARYADDLLEGEDRARLLRFARDLYAQRLDEIGEPQSTEQRLLADRLAAFLAEEAKDEEVRAALAAAAARYVGMEGEPDTQALDPDRFETAFTVGVQDLGLPFYERLLAVRDEIDDPRLGGASAGALGAVTEDELVKRARAVALSGELGTRETWGLVTTLFEQPGTAEENWAWYKENFADLLPLIPEQWRRRTPTVAGAFCEAEKVADVEAFFAKVGEDVPGHERRLTETVEEIRLCAALREEKAEELASALKTALADR